MSTTELPVNAVCPRTAERRKLCKFLIKFSKSSCSCQRWTISRKKHSEFLRHAHVVHYLVRFAKPLRKVSIALQNNLADLDARTYIIFIHHSRTHAFALTVWCSRFLIRHCEFAKKVETIFLTKQTS